MGLLSALEPGIACAGEEETATATVINCVAYVGATVVTLAITKLADSFSCHQGYSLCLIIWASHALNSLRLNPCSASSHSTALLQIMKNRSEGGS